ncbi:hypothetical protein P9112_010721 [Eukaryota sp. TZLM1-RC]
MVHVSACLTVEASKICNPCASSVLSPLRSFARIDGCNFACTYTGPFRAPCIDVCPPFLGERVLSVRNSIERDGALVDATVSATEQNQQSVDTDHRLLSRRRTSRWSWFYDICLLLIVVMITTFMVLIMKLFPKPR